MLRMLLVGLSLTAVSPVLAREWTDHTGRYSVEAELVEVKDGKAWLRKTDGKVVAVEVTRLSKTDRDYLESIEKNGADAEQDKVAWEQSISAIKKFGGALHIDEERPQAALITAWLNDTAVTDADLEHLKGHTSLEILVLRDTSITDAGLEHLAGLTNLWKLDLDATRITGAGLRHLKGLKKLHSLYVAHTRLTDAGLEHLKGHASLGLLGLEDTSITDAGLEHLAGLTRLRMLHLGATKITGAGLRHLKGMNNLRTLYVARTELTDAGLEHLAGLTSLTLLDLDTTNITGAGLAHLKGLKNLETLYVAETEVTDAGLAHLKGLENLETLDVDETKVTDAGLEHLTGLTSLKKLSLWGTKIGDAGLEHLTRMTSLQTLDLYDTQISDTGLEHLRALPNLQTLDLRGTRVSNEGVEKFRRAMPKCDVKHSTGFAAPLPDVPTTEPEITPLRTWQDEAGKFEVEAAFVELKGDKAYLRMADGKIVDVKVLDLRIEDRRALAQSIVERTVSELRFGRSEKPLAELNDLLQLNPECGPAFYARSQVWLSRGDLRRALADVNTAIELMSDTASLYLIRCIVHNALGNRELAIADHREAVRGGAPFPGGNSQIDGDIDLEQSTDTQDDRRADEAGPFDEQQLPPDRKPPFTITVSRETTRVVGPLRKDGSVDFLAAVNAHFRRGVTPENNAATKLFEALGPGEIDEDDRESYFQLLGLPVLPADGPYFVSLIQFLDDRSREEPPVAEGDVGGDPWETRKAAHRRPWASNEFPELAEWILANDQPLGLVVEASERPRYYEPLIVEDDLPLAAVWLPLMGDVRRASRLLACRAMLRLQEGKVSEARQDLLACHRLARLLEQGPTLVHALCAASIASLTCSGDAALAHHGNLSAQQARRYAAELNEIAPNFHVGSKIDALERYFCLDSVVRVASGGPAEFVDITNWVQSLSSDLDIVDPQERPSKAYRVWSYNETLDWDNVLRRVNQWYDHLVADYDHPTRAARIAALKKRDEDVRVMADRLERNWRPLAKLSFGFGVVAPETKAKHVAELMICLATPSFQSMFDAEGEAIVQWQMARLAYALAGYRADHGSYPERLSRLSPKYIDEIPTDLFTGEQLRYTRVADDDYRLYSLGPNGNDDDGGEDDVTLDFR